jgi:predicted XRE-type DNA-binding protein
MKLVNKHSVPANRPLVVEKSSGNLFADFGFSKTKAANLAMRTNCIIAIETWFVSSGLTHAMAAKQLGIKLSKFETLLNGVVEQFTIDYLLKVALNAGFTAKLTLRVVKDKTA